MRSANEVTATLCMDPIFTIILWNIDFIDCIYKHLSIQWRSCQGIPQIDLLEELALLFTSVLIAYVLFYSFFAHIAYGSCMIYAFLCAYLTLFSSLYIL